MAEQLKVQNITPVSDPQESISPHWFECNPCYMWKVDLLLKPFQCSKLTLGLRICTLANSNSFPDWIEKIKVSAFCLGTAGQNSQSKHGHGKQTKCASKLEAWEQSSRHAVASNFQNKMRNQMFFSRRAHVARVFGRVLGKTAFGTS